jgi:hypothetical protein
MGRVHHADGGRRERCRSLVALVRRTEAASTV